MAKKEKELSYGPTVPDGNRTCRKSIAKAYSAPRNCDHEYTYPAERNCRFGQVGADPWKNKPFKLKVLSALLLVW